MALNRCEFIGNLGRDPEVRTFQNGDKVCNLRIAVTERWRDKSSGERKERTEWIPITVHGGLVKIAEQFLKKGSKVYVAGQFATRKWQDQNGTDRYSTEIVLRGFDCKLELLDGKQEGQGGGSGGYDRHDDGGVVDNGAGGSPGGGRRNDIDDEIPF